MEGLLSFLVIGALFYLVMRFSWGAHGVHGHGGHGERGAASPRDVDPVCGMELTPEQGYGKMHEGKPYRFCSRKCLDQFEQDPQRYLSGRHAHEEKHP